MQRNRARAMVKALDERLREILEETDVAQHKEYLIAQIHKAYRTYLNGNNYMVVPKADNYMTGEAWFDRFIAEVEHMRKITPPGSMSPKEALDSIEQAAKRAAGLKS